MICPNRSSEDLGKMEFRIFPRLGVSSLQYRQDASGGVSPRREWRKSPHHTPPPAHWDSVLVTTPKSAPLRRWPGLFRFRPRFADHSRAEVHSALALTPPAGF